MHKPNITQEDLTQRLKEKHLFTPKVQQALQISVDVHVLQIRDDGASYLEQHIFPITVAVLENFDEIDLLERAVIVSLLHDVLEEEQSVCTEQSLREEFGEAICKELLVLQKHRHTNIERTHAVKHQEHAELAGRLMGASRLVRFIKVIDRLNNLKCTEGNLDSAKYERFLHDTVAFYVPLAETVDMRYANEMREEIERISKELS